MGIKNFGFFLPCLYLRFTDISIKKKDILSCAIDINKHKE